MMVTNPWCSRRPWPGEKMDTTDRVPGIDFESSIASAPGTLLYWTVLPSCAAMLEDIPVGYMFPK